jgi:hypothetical protein
MSTELPNRDAPPNTADSVVIARRFRGPPQSANGGYTAGLLAAHAPGVVCVTLRQPPPLDEPLALRGSGSELHLLQGDRLIAHAVPAVLPDDAPAAVTIEAAAAASEHYAWKTGHLFQGCFVCGTERAEADGLRIHPGPVAGRHVVAAPWVPDASVGDDEGRVRSEVVWAALDCPSWFGALEFAAGAPAALLGQITARIVARPRTGEPCVAVGWARGREGRKQFAGAALYSATGALLAMSHALWIEPRTENTR